MKSYVGIYQLDEEELMSYWLFGAKSIGYKGVLGMSVNNSYTLAAGKRDSQYGKILLYLNGNGPTKKIDMIEKRFNRNLSEALQREEEIAAKYCSYRPSKYPLRGQNSNIFSVLHASGDGVLKEYETKFIRHKGTAIGGMECHSPR